MSQAQPSSTCDSTVAIGIRGIAYHFDETAPVEEIQALAKEPRLLAAFKAGGHERFARSNVSVSEQAVVCARRSLAHANLVDTDIDAIVIGTSELSYWNRLAEMFSTEILMGLGLRNVLAVGVTMAGCANYGSSLRMARNILIAEGARNVLVVETNQVRGDMQRQLVSLPSGFAGAIFGDCAVSFVATTGAADFAVIGMAQIIKPIDKEKATLADVIANNVAGYRHVTECALRCAGISRADLCKVFMSNVNIEVLAGLAAIVDVPESLVYTENVSRLGHLWSADNLVGLSDYCQSNAVPDGAVFILLCQADSYFSAVVCRKQ